MRKQFDFDDETPYVVVEKHSGGVGSFLMGLAIGAGVALLFAPQSGEETRRGIRRKAQSVRDGAQDAVSGAAERVMDTFENARARVEEEIDRAREAVELRKDQVSRAVRAGRQAARDARGDLEQRIAEAKASYEDGMGPTRRSRGPRRAGMGAGMAAPEVIVEEVTLEVRGEGLEDDIDGV